MIKMLLLAIVKAAEYKKYTILILSVSLSSILGTLEQFLKLEFFGINYSFLILASILIVIDFLTGAVASRFENRIHGKRDWFKSQNVSYTVYKFLSIFLLLWLTDEVHKNLEYLIATTEKGFTKSFYISSSGFLSIARATVFFLICGREFVSIGENIERRFGKKPYLFQLFGKLLDIIEIKFMRKIEDSDYCTKELDPQEKNKSNYED